MILIQTCPECKNSLITDLVLGQTTCTTCGLVISEREVDIKNYGMRSYNMEDENNRSHHGDLVGMFSLDLSTIIQYKKEQNYIKWNRLVYRNNWKFNNSRHSLSNGSIEIKRIKAILEIPYQTIEMAMLLFRKAYKADLIKGRSVNGMVDACLYYACRKHKIPISYLEIIKQNDIKHHHFFRCYYILTKEFNLNPGIIFPKTFIAKYCNMFELPMKCEKETIKIIDLLPKQYFSGKNPKGIIGGIIYLVCKLEGLYYNQEKFAEKIGITAVTLRSRYQELRRLLKEKRNE